MTHAVARRAVNGSVVIPQSLPVPPMPAKVAAHLRDLRAFTDARETWRGSHPSEREDGFVGMAPRMPALIAAERAEAEVALRDLDREAAPVSLDAFRAWLGPVNSAVRNPQGEQDFAVRCLGLFAMLDDLPAGCFTAEARRTLPAFFPSAADIRAAVEPGAGHLRRARDVLAKALRGDQAEPADDAGQHQPATQAEIAAVKAKVRAFLAETTAPTAAAVRASGKPAPLSDGALEAHYAALAAQGNAAAAIRVKAYQRAREAGR